MKRLRTPKSRATALRPRALSVSLARFTSAVAICSALFSAVGHAAPYYWDSDGSATGNSVSGTNLGGIGTWDLTGARFWAPLAASNTIWDNTANANDTVIVQGGTAGAITLGTNISAGSLVFRTTGYSVTGNTLTLGTPASVVFGSNLAAATIGSIIDGSNGLTFNGNGSGTLSLTAANTLSAGAITINSGRLQLSANTGSFTNATLPMTFGGTGAFKYENSSTTGAKSQAFGALTFAGGEGTVGYARVVTAQNLFLTYASLGTRAEGATGNFVNANGGAGSIGTNGAITITSLASTPGFMGPGYFTGTATGGPYGSYAYYDTTLGIKSVRALSYSDAGTGTTGTAATLGAAATGLNMQMTGAITGQTTDNVNTLRISGASNLTLAGVATLTFGGSGAGGILKAGNTAAVISGGTAITAGGSGNELIIRTDDVSDALTVTTPIASSTGALTKSGLGTLTLNAVNAYTGTTYLNAGTLVAQGAGALGTGTSVRLNGGVTQDVSSATILSLQADTAGGLGTRESMTDFSTKNFSVVGNANITAGRRTVTSNLNKTIRLGALTLGEDTLAVTNNNGYGLEFTGAVSLTGNTASTFNSASAATAQNLVQGVALSGVISSTNPVGLIKTGPGTLVLGNSDLTTANTFGGTDALIDIQGGILAAGYDGALGLGANRVVLNTNSATQGFRATQSFGSSRAFVLAAAANDIEVIQGKALTLSTPFIVPVATNGLTKNDYGTLILTGSNSGWTGAISIAQGALQASGNTASVLGSGAIAVTQIAGPTGSAALQLKNGVTLANNVSLNNTGLNFGGALQSVSGANTVSGAITLATAASIGVDAGTLDLTSATPISGAFSLILAGAGTGNVNSGIGSTVTGLTKMGTGIWNLNSAASIATTAGVLVNGGTLALTGSTGALTSAGTGFIVVSPGGTFLVDDTGTHLANRLGTAARAVTLSGGALTIKGNTGVATAETVSTGTLTLGGGGSVISLDDTGNTVGGLRLNAGTLAAPSPAGTAVLRGSSLGGPLGSAAVSNLVVTTPTLVGGGGAADTTTMSIRPDILGDTNATTGVGTGFVTSVATTGFRTLNTSTELAASITGGSAANVALTSGNLFAGPVTVNSLTLNTGASLTNLTSSTALTLGVAGGAGLLALDTSVSGNTITGGFITPNSNAPFFVHTVGNLNLASTVTGTTGGLTKADGGALNVLTPQYYTGTTAINGGTLKLPSGATNALLFNNTLTLNNGGTLDLNGGVQYVGTLNSTQPAAFATQVPGGTIKSSTATESGTIITSPAISVNFGGTIDGANVNFVRSGNASFINVFFPLTYGGTTLINGGSQTSGLNGLVSVGTILTDNGELTNTSSITLSYATLALDNSRLAENNNRVRDAAPITMNGGTITLSGRAGSLTTETVGAVTLNQGTSTFTAADGSNAPYGVKGAALTLTSLSRTANSGATMMFAQNFSGTGGGTASGTLGVLGTTGTTQNIFINGANHNTNTNNILAPYAVVGGFFNTTAVELASYSTSNGVGALSSAGFAGYDGSAFPASNQPTQNFKLTAAAAVPSLPQLIGLGLTVNALNLAPNTTSAVAFTFANAGDTLNLASGGLIVQNPIASAGAITIGTTLLPGAITAGGTSPTAPQDLYLYYFGNGSAVLTINSQIKDNGQPVRLVAWGGEWRPDSTGGITLAGANNYTGGTIINQQTLNIAATGTLPGNGLTINSGTVTQVAGGTVTSQAVTLNGGSVLTLAGANTLTSLTFNNNGGTVVPTVTTGGVLTLPGSTSITASSSNVGTTALIGATAGTGTVDFGGNTPTITVNPIMVTGTPTGLGTFTGGTNVAPWQATLNINSLLQNANGITVAGGALGANPGGVLQLSATTSTFAGGVSLTGNAGLIIGASSNPTTVEPASLTSGPLGTGTLTIGTGSTLLSSAGTNIISNPVTLSGAGLAFAGTNNLTLNGKITQSGTTTYTVLTPSVTLTIGGRIDPAPGSGLVKDGLGTLALTNIANPYTGGTTVNAGTLNIAADGSLGVAPGTFQADQLILNNGGALGTTANATLTANRGITLSGTSGVFSPANILTVNGKLTGSAPLVMSGAGTLALTADSSSSYTGAALLAAGTLNINADAALGAVPGSPTTKLTFNSAATLQAGAPSVTLVANRNIVIGSGVTASFDSNGNALSIAGQISGGNVTKLGAGTVTFTGNNTYNGLTTLTAGTLSVGSSANLGDASAANKLAFGGGILQATGTFSLGTTRTVALNTGGGTIDVSGSETLTLPGLITGVAANAFNKIGTGTLVLTNVSNSYAGPTNVNTGTLNLGGGAGTSVVGPGLLSVNSGGVLSGAGVVAGGITLNFASAATFTPVALAPINTSSGALTVTGASSINIAGTTPAVGTYPLIDYGGTALTAAQFANFRVGSTPGGSVFYGLSNNTGSTSLDLVVEALASSVTWTGATNGTWDTTTTNWSAPGTYADGNQVLFNDSGSNKTITGGPVSPQSITVNNTVGNNYSIANNITGPVIGGLAKSGNGTLILTGANTISGPINVTGGTLRAPITPTATPLGTGAITLTNSTLQLDPTATTTVGLTGRRLAGNSTTTANLNFTGTSTLVGTNFATGGLTFASAAAESYQWTGKINIPATGNWAFFNSNDDAGRLFIDGNLVVQVEGGHAALETGGMINLSAGYHDLRLDFSNTSGAGSETISWQGPGVLAKTVVPSANLFTSETASTAGASNAIALTNNVSVAGTSTINLNGTNFVTVQIGGLSSAAGSTLNVTGLTGKQLRSAGTLLSGGGTVTYNTTPDLALGQVGDGGVAVSVAKQGPGRLILDNTGAGGFASNLLSTSTFDIQAGEMLLQGINGGTNPAGSARIQLNGGNLSLDSRFGAATYDNAVNVLLDATIEVVPSSVTLTLGSAASGLTIASGKSLTVDAFGGSRTSSPAGTAVAGATLQISGGIGGAGNLALQSTQFNAGQYPVPGALIATAANSFSGTTKLTGTYTNATNQLTLNLNSNGTLANTSGIQLSRARLVIDSSALQPDRVKNTTGIALDNGTLTFTGSTTAHSGEAFGALTLNSGYNLVSMSGIGATVSTTLNPDSLVRTAGNRGTVSFQGASLGATALNADLVKFNTAPALIGAGGTAGTTTMSILPYAVATAQASGTLTWGLATYDVNGIRPLNTGTEYTTLGGSTPTSNARSVLTTSTSTSGQTVNAYVIDNTSTTAGVTVTVSGGTTLAPTSGALIFTATSATQQALTLTGGTLDFGTAEGVISVMDTAGATVSSKISGSNGLTVNGIGALTLTNTGVNDFTGMLTVNGTLNLSADAALGAATNPVQFGGGTLKFNAAGITLASTRTITSLANTQAVFDTSANSGTIAGQVTGAGGLFKIGANTLTLNNASNDYSGASNVFVGSLVTNSRPQGSITLGVSTTLTFDQTFDLPYAGNISGLGTFTKTGAGSVTLTGINTYVGATTINGGTLTMGVANSLPDGGTLVIGAGAGSTGTLALNGFNLSTANLTFGGAAATATTQGTINVGSGSTLTLNGPVTYTSTGNPLGASVTGGTVDLASATRTFTIGDSTSTGAELAISSVIANGGITKAGTGTMVLTGANTYAGPTTIQAGALQANSGAGLSAASALVLDGGVLQGNGTAAFNRNLGTGANQVTWTSNGGGFSAQGGPLTVQLNGGTATQTWGATDFVPSGSALIFGSTSSDNQVDFQNGINLGTTGGNTRTITVNGGLGGDSAKISGNITTTGVNNGLLKNGSGTLILSGTNSNDGLTTVNLGLLSVSADANLGTATNALTLNGGGLQVTGTTYTALPTAHPLTIGTSGGSFDIASAANTFTINQVLTAANTTGTVTKTGPGTLVLTGATVFSPTSATIALQVNGGTLNLAAGGSIAAGANSGDIQVANAANSRGIFNIAAGQTVNPGATREIDAGRGDNSVGVVNQTGGTVTSANTFLYGGATTAGYGEYNISGGTLTYTSGGATPRFRIGGAGGNNVGILYQSGGSITNNGVTFELNNQAAVTTTSSWATGYFTGGSYTSNQAVTLGGKLGQADLSIAGSGSVTTGAITMALAGAGAGSLAGILNLDGGSLTASTIVVGDATKTTLLNFNGGTLKPSASTTTFLQGLSNAYIYSGGGTIDTNGFNITVNQLFQSPAGNGLTSISAASSANFIGNPYVQISGGGGIGATAFANIDNNPLSATYGQITSFTITNPGTGYTSAPTVTLIGGGGTATSVIAALNAGNADTGVLNKNGAGVLTLTQPIAWGGGASVNAGTLRIASGVTVSSNITVNGGVLENQGLILQGAGQIILVNGLTTLSSPTENANTIIQNTSHGVAALNFNNSGTTGVNGSDVFLGAVGNRIYSGTLLAAGSAATYRFGGGYHWSNPALAASGGSGGYLQISAANVVTGANNVLIGDQTIIGGNSTVQFTAAQNYTGTTTLAGGTLVFTDPNQLGSPATVANSLVLDGGILQWGPATTTDLSNRLGLKSGGSIDTGANNVTFTTAIANTGGGTGGLNKLGSGILTLSKANTYAGPTTVSRGTLKLDFSASGAAANDILLNTSQLVLAGGTFNPNGTGGTTVNSQTFAGTTIASGGSTLTSTFQAATSGAGADTITLGPLTRNNGGTVAFSIGTNATVANTTFGTTSGTAATLVTDANGVAYATIGNDWAAKDSGNTKLVAVGTAGSAVYTTNTTAVLAGNANVTGNSTTLAANTSISSLRFNEATNARTITVTGFTLTTGGILQGTTAAVTETFTGGTLTAPVNGDLTLINLSGSTLSIGSVIANNAGNTAGVGTGLTKSGTGPLTLTGTNTYTGVTTLNGGVVNINNNVAASTNGPLGNAAAAAGNLIINGATLTDTAATTHTFGRLFSIGLNGATIDSSVGSANTWTFNQTGALGFVGLGARSLTLGGSNTGANVFSPIITDNGGPTSLNKTGNGTWVLNGVNSYTGTTTITQSILRLNVAGALPGGLGALAGSTNTTNTGGGNLTFAATGTNFAALDLTPASGDFFRPLGTGPDQVQFTGNGGFTATGGDRIVNLGGQVTPSQVTWGSGSFVPSSSILFLSQGSATPSTGTLTFQNPIALAGAARTIQSDNGSVTNGIESILSGAITSAAGGSITKTGLGVLQLSGVNNGAGNAATMTVNATASGNIGGYVVFADANAIPGDSSLVARSVTVNANNAAVLLAADPNPLLSRITTGSAGVLALNAASTTGTAPSTAFLDFSNNASLFLGAFSNPGGTPAYFGGTIIPAANTFRIGSAGMVANGAQGGTATAIQGSYNILALTRTNLLADGASPRSLVLGSGINLFTTWNSYTGGTSTAATNGDSDNGVGNDSPFGTGTFTSNNTNGWLGPVNGDHTLSNNVTATAVGNFVVAGDTSRRGLANGGALTYAGTLTLPLTVNLFAETGREAIYLGDVKASGATTGVTLSNNSNGLHAFLTTPVGGVAKHQTVTGIAINSTMIIDSDTSLGTVPASATTSINFTGNANNTITNPSLWVQPGSGGILLDANRNLSINTNVAPTIRVDLADKLTIPGVISTGGTGAVTKSGLGTLSLRGTNTFTTTTGLAIIGGNLELDYANLVGAGPILTAAPITLGGSAGGSGGTLSIVSGASAVSQTLGNLTINGKANFISLSGGSSITLTVGNTAFARSVGGTLGLTVLNSTITAGTSTGTASKVITDAGGNAYATFNGNDWAAKDPANTSILGASVAGTAGASIYSPNGATSLTASSDTDLTTASSLSAASTTINTLRFNTAGGLTLNVNANTLITGGILVGDGTGTGNSTLASATSTTGALLGTGGTVKELVIIQNNVTGDGVATGLLTISAPINDNAAATALTKSGPGTVVLTGTNNFTGATYFDQGVLEIGSIAAGGTASPAGKASNVAANWVFNGGTLRYNSATAGTTDRGATFNAVSTIDVPGAGGLTIGSGSIGIAGVATIPGILRKTGAGALTLGGTGDNANLSAEVVAGTLNFGKTSSSAVHALGHVGAALIVGSGATARITGGGNDQIYDGSAVLVKTGGTFDLNALSEGIDGLAGGGTVTSSTAATLTLGLFHDAGISANTIYAALAGVGATGLNNFTGAITGAISLTKTGAGTQILGGTGLAYTGTTTINGGTLRMSAANVLPSGPTKGNVSITSGTYAGLFVPGNLDLGGFDQAINGLSGTGLVTNTLPLSAVANATSTLQVGNNDATGAANTFSGILQDGLTIIPGVSPVAYRGSLALNKVGTGTLTLSGPNTFSGDVNVNGGTLAANLGNNSFNPASSALGNPQVARNINVNNGGTLLFTAGDTLGGNDSTILSTLVINAGGTVTNTPFFNTFGPVQLNGGTLTGTGGAANPNFQMYSLQGTVTVGGTAASTISGSGAFAGYHLSANTTFNVADATGDANSDLNVSGLLIDRQAALGAGGLTKSGAGTMALSGANTYTGPTNVSAGILLINGLQGSATGAVTVSSGATLGGNGTIGGAVTVQNGGNLKPGTSAGLLTLNNNLTLGGNTTNSTFEIQGTARGVAGGYDAINLGVSSTLTYVGILTLDISSTLPNGTTFDLFSFTNAPVGNFFNVTLTGTGGYSGSLTNNSGIWTGDSLGQSFTFTQATGDLVVGVVPEPGALVSLLGGLGILLGFRRSRRHQ
ncbi:MAG: fibronectin-binding autotransporter adhesin [Chthoniobacter sp.]|jgi:autotransporter-associated beta strand protein|nr:fibronectin-binding autotransporter adhesin [Chthoniobacter sp.]